MAFLTAITRPTTGISVTELRNMIFTLEAGDEAKAYLPSVLESIPLYLLLEYVVPVLN
jgi:hypothetical protein